MQSRPAAEGLIGVFVDQKSTSAVAVEVNCETDFVARNEIFRNLVSDLTKTVASATIVNESGNSVSLSDQGLAQKYSLVQDQMQPFRESLIPAITQLGENIILKRALFLKSTEGSGVKITGYAHAVGGQSNTHRGIHVGKYGTLLAYAEPAEPNQDAEHHKEQSDTGSSQTEAKTGQTSSESKGQDTDPDKIIVLDSGEVVAEFEESSFEQTRLETEHYSQDEVAKLLCQHIVGMKPTRIRESVEEKEERLRLQRLRRESGHKDDGDEDSEVLLDQAFLLDQQITIRQLLSEKNMRVVDFARLECGVYDSGN